MDNAKQLEDRIRKHLADARTMLDGFGLTDWRIALDKRPTRRLGQTRYSKHTIGLSARFLAYNDWAQVEQVVRHEAAHAAVGPGHGHGPVWKAKAREFGLARPRYAMANVAMYASEVAR